LCNPVSLRGGLWQLVGRQTPNQSVQWLSVALKRDRYAQCGAVGQASSGKTVSATARMPLSELELILE